MKNWTQRTIAVFATAAVLASASAVALAADDTPPAERPAAEHSHRRHPRLLRGAAATISELLDMSKRDIASALRDGSSIADLAEAIGSSGDAVIDALYTQMSDRIEQAVVDSRIDRERADRILESARDRIERFVDTPHEVRPHRPGRVRIARDAIEVVTDTLGVDRSDVVDTWRSGGTVADLAGANGSSGDAVADALLQALSEQLDGAVADGNLDRDRAQQILEKAPDRIHRMVFEPRGRHRATDS